MSISPAFYHLTQSSSSFLEDFIKSGLFPVYDVRNQVSLC